MTLSSVNVWPTCTPDFLRRVFRWTPRCGWNGAARRRCIYLILVQTVPVICRSAARSDSETILCRDPRNPVAPLRRHSSTHSDDITSIKFSPQGSSEILLSASTDGLVCTSNPREEDEDEAGLHVGNWGCSVSKAGWMSRHGSATGSTNPACWAASDMETLGLWSDEVTPFNYCICA